MYKKNLNLVTNVYQITIKQLKTIIISRLRANKHTEKNGYNK